MSLIRQRKLRKKNWVDVRRGMATTKLIVLLLFVVAIIWYLDRF
ncbi:MAG TPA: hypothetical protein VFQ22_05495 [Longimicrobiales bacterium]|nr:hypothetical protein [Longimicrobiales bacterium]